MEEYIKAQSKVCSKCGIDKNISEFSKDSQKKDGLRSSCRECHKINVKKYSLSEAGVISNIISQENRRSKTRGHPLPNYTRKELEEFLYSNGFKEIYNNYVDTGYNTNFRPSVDRINCNLPYTLDNIQLMTWQENNEKGKLENSYKILIKNENFNKIMNLSKAAKFLGVSQEKVKIKNKSYIKDYYIEIIKSLNIKANRTPVVCYDDKGIVYKIFKTQAEACRYFNVSYSTISIKRLEDHNKRCGYYWRYATKEEIKTLLY